MWYFVERKGRAIKKTKYLFAAQLACVGIAESGVPESELKITDCSGKEYPKVGL